MTPIEKYRKEFWNEVEPGSVLKTYVVSLRVGDKKTLQAEDIDTDDGALYGLIYDPHHVDGKGLMSAKTVWAFAPGEWIFVERDWEADMVAEEEKENEAHP